MKSYVIHLIRHGMTQANLTGQYAGSWDIPLCKEGEEKLKQLKKNFEYPFAEEIYSSPLKRCLQTCEIIYPGISCIAVDGLKECNFGDWEKKTHSELKNDEHHIKWIENSNIMAPPNGESWEDLYQRVSVAFEEIVKSLMTRGVTSAAIVTHGGVMMTILHRYGIPKAQFYDWMVDNGCGYSVRITPGLWMRDKVFEVYDKIPLGADISINGNFKKLMDDLVQK